MSQRFLPPVDSNPILLVDATSAAENVYLPAQFATSRKFTIRRKDSTANLVTVRVATGQTLDGVTNGTATIPGNGEAAFVALETGQWESFIGGSGNSSGGSGSGSAAGYNPVNYGCAYDWNGTTGTDDTAALTAFFAARSAGDIVDLPPNRTALVSGSGFTIGPAFTKGILRGNNAKFKMNPASGSGSQVANITAPGITIQDLIVDCSGNTVPSVTGLRLQASDQTVKDCKFIDPGLAGIYIMGAISGIDIVDNRFDGNGWGVLTQDACTVSFLTIHNNHFTGGSAGDAIEINTPTGGASHVTITANQIRNYTGTVSSGFGVGVAHASFVTIQGNQINNLTADGIHIEDGSRQVTISGNQISNIANTGAGINVLESVSVSGSSSLTAIVGIDGNMVNACTGGGILIQGSGGAQAADYSVVNNKVYGCGTAASGSYKYGIQLGYQTYRSSVTGNHVFNTKGTGSAGIALGDATATVSNNVLGDTQGSPTQQYGILATGASVITLGRDNRFSGNVTADLATQNSARFVDDILPNAPLLAVLRDSYNRPDSSPNLGVTSDYRQTWTTCTALCISGGRATSIPATLAEGISWVEAGKTDFTYEQTLMAIGDMGMTWRNVDNANGFMVIPISGNYYQVYKHTAGSKASIGTGGSAPVVGDRIRVVTSANTHTVYVNGQKVYGFSDSSYNTATKVGLRAGGGSAGQFDDLLVY